MTGASLSFTAAYRSILTADGGSRIFHDFGFTVGERTVSPFRTDARKKNFSIYRNPKGEVCFKDFASGDGGTFTALLHGFGYTTFEAQIRYAAQLYAIELKDESESGHTYKAERRTVTESRTKRQVTNNQATKRYRVTALELANFTSVELETLARISGGFITRELLERFGIRALRSYTDEGVSAKGTFYGGTHEARFTLVVPSADGNYYGYCYFSAETHSPFPHRSKNFHLKLNDYTAEVKFALGLNELRPNESAYIVEGIKDCLILLAKGYNAFTLGGVQHRLLPSIVKRLQENGNSVNVVFDTDFAGINAAQKLSTSLSNSTVFAPLSKGERGIVQHNALSQHGASIHHCICTLPRLQRQETKDAPKPALNDLADYVCTYGFDTELKNALLSPAPLRCITLSKSGDADNGYAIPAWQLSVHCKLSDEKPALKALTNLLESASRLVLRAPTGCGKTYTVLRHIAPEHHRKTGGVTVLAVPTVAMAEQIKNEYSDLKPIVITGNESDLHRLYADAPLDTCVIVSVYDSAARLLDVISEPTTLLVVDEMHKLVCDYDYRTPAMRTMLRLIKQAHRTLCLSATPELLFHEAPLNFTYCDVDVQQKRPLRFQQCAYDKREETVIDTILTTLNEHPSTTILLNVNSKKLLKRTKILLLKSGIADNDVDIVTRDTMDTSPEYRSATEQSRFTRRVILTTSVLDCGVNILNTGRVQILMLDEKNEDTIIQVANRFRKADAIDVMLFSSKTQGTSKQIPRKHATNNQVPLFNEQHHFLQTLLSAEMVAEAFNAAHGRNHTADCGVGRKSTSRLQDTMLHFNTNNNRWSTDECAIMYRIHTLRLTMKTPDDVAKALEGYGFVRIVDEPISKPGGLLSPEIVKEVREEEKRETLHNEETVLNLLEHKTAYFLAALNTLSRSKALKDTLPTICPESLLPFMKQHPETTAILTNFAALLREQRTETLVRYYSEARTLGFDHTEALHLVRTNKDPRKWASFTERLAIKQREAISLAGLTDSILSKHDREKLRREEEIRRLITSTAEIGCALTNADGTQRHIPNAIRTKKEIADRANAYTGFMFRLTQQRAGELTDALFHVRYVRERVKTENGTRFSGHYTFDNDGKELKRKTLAEFVSEYGVDGVRYTAQFMERAKNEARLYDEAEERRVLHYEDICAGSGV
ncbi:MAG: DEAD/DEAH box helicase [Ignavibacteria bacterium]|nr:DEAD/DEAH box helicase [Ignavibacteria bacterium]